MSLSSKTKSAFNALALTSAVVLNTGRIPSRHKGVVLIEPTSVCNLKCPLCPTGTGTLERKNKYIDLDVLERIIEITKPFAIAYVLNLFGEPMFHPEIGKILAKTAHAPGWLSTNLSYDDKYAHELARWEHLHVICSIDTVKPESYSEYRRGGSWEKVMHNLDILAKGKCTVHPQFLVEKGHYESQVYEQFAEEHGIPKKDVIIKRKMENFRLDVAKEPRLGRCHSAYADLYFNCDGYLVPCCNNVRKDVYMQHINDLNTLEDIFSAPKCVAIRRRLANNKNVFPSCTDCDGLDFFKVQFPQYVHAAKSLIPWVTLDSDEPMKMKL
ncbi:radical SAM/SPASM domain-containing protein [Salidesulfovibrio brasiliensis]|uniref:radical SAM/SPASM domain-containing protein n=1 Tax=Salidesulfovibrio brasiliensis TaxID=221711 RepID=UPI0009FB0488|nr:radical SAM/SPASM domain-containing protein [Salidesulfovibrio brasiliensis]